MNTTSLIEKYEPRQIEDICGNQTLFRKVEKDMLLNRKRGIYLFYGKNGCGKTLFCNLLCKKYKIYKIYITIENISEKYLQSLKRSNSIIKRAIIIDGIDLFHKTELKILKDSGLLDKKNELVFLISNDNKEFKKNKVIKKFCFRKILDSQVLKFLKNIIQLEGYKLSDNIDYMLDLVIKEANGDIRFILINLDLFLLSLGDKVKYSQKNQDYIKKNILINREVGFFKCSGKSLLECDINKQLTYYFENQTVPMYHFEYYPQFKKASLVNLADMSKSICDGDIISNNINWALKKYESIMGCTTPVVIGGGYRGMARFPQYWGKIRKRDNNLHFKLTQN